MTRKPFSLGRTPREAYLLAAEITKAGQYFEREEGQLRAVLASLKVTDDSSRTPSAEAALVCGQQLARLQAARERFDGRFPTDPAGAVEELKRVRDQMLDLQSAGKGKHAARDAALARAVDHVHEWLCQQKKPPERTFRAMPVTTIGLISKRRVRDLTDLKKLAAHPTVRKALKGEAAKRGSQKWAAQVLVALAVGIGEQTVKRASDLKKPRVKKALKHRAKAAKGSLSRRK